MADHQPDERAGYRRPPRHRQFRKGQSGKKDPSIPDGLKSLRHPDPTVRYNSASLLLELGPVAKFAIPALRDGSSLRPLVRPSRFVIGVIAAEAMSVPAMFPAMRLRAVR